MKKAILPLLAAMAMTISCKSTKVTTDTLSAHDWTLISISGKTPNANERIKPTIKFTDSTMQGNGGCNSFNGGYTINEAGEFNAGRVVSTKMFCEGSNENEFFTALAKANKIKMDKNKLIFMHDEHELLVFAPDKK